MDACFTVEEKYVETVCKKLNEIFDKNKVKVIINLKNLKNDKKNILKKSISYELSGDEFIKLNESKKDLEKIVEIIGKEVRKFDWRTENVIGEMVESYKSGPSRIPMVKWGPIGNINRRKSK